MTEQPEARRWCARMLIDRSGPGNRERARELLTEVIALYTKIGMPKHLEPTIRSAKTEGCLSIEDRRLP